jgi:uncharacterized membrane protein
MKQQKWKEIIFNACIVLNCFLVFLLAFGASLQLPSILQVVGRAHPLVLHFPIVLLLLSVVFEMIMVNRQTTNLTDVADWMLLSATLTTVAAALMGLFLSNEEGYDAGAIATHKWVGAACAIISLLWYAFRVQLRKKKLATMMTGFACTAALLITGHEGASITHGQDFLLEPISAKTATPEVWLEDAVIYTHLIKPILTEKCMSCHSSSKAKGDLILETQTLLLKGGKNGKLWDTTATGLGLMMERLHLPLASKEHMPPKGKPQLTEEEVKALYYWIKGGASFIKKVNELPANDSLKMIAQGFFKNVETESYAFEPADDAVIAKLNTTYRAVSVISYKSPALAVSFFGATFFKSEQLKELEKIKDNIVSLDLYKMPVTDQDLKTIATFTNLRKLNIAFTKINGEGLSNLSKLQHLQQLSISGTSIQLAHLKPLVSLKKLSAVYIWNTGITKEEQTALKKQFPNTHFNMGYKSDTVIAKLTRPVIEGDVSVFSADLKVKFKKHIKGTIIRYTLDGTDPDSLKSPIYKDHVLIKQAGLLKAKAFLPGWISSDVAAEYFYKSLYKPDSARLLTPPNPSYKVNGALSLFDGERGSNSFITGQWLGYRENNFEALLYFNTPIELSAVTFGNLADINSYLMPPKELQVWGGNSPTSLKLLGKINPTQPNKVLPAAVMGFDCRFPKQKVSVIKLVGIPVNPLPKWHPGKGDRGWLFLDEVFLN